MKKSVDIQEILKKLTLDEKIGQLMQLATPFFLPESRGEITGPLAELGIEEELIWRSGSVLGINNAEDVITIQKRYLEKSPHQIPLLFMADIIHGYRTIFPVPLALACSWDTETAQICAEVSKKEAALSGLHVTFSPMADLTRDPRWGRVMEGTGEDAYLNGEFARAFVKGFQGDLTGEYDLIACVKHFAGYGAVESGRDYNTVDMSDRHLREYYLPAYRAAIDAGVKMVMTSFNTIHGIPATGNAYLMRDILRKEWGFNGVVISDWGAVGELLQHGVAQKGKEAAEMAANATVDIEMMTPHYVKNLKNLVLEGKVSEDLIDASVIRILELKKSFGLFENPFKVADPEKAKEAFLCKEHRQLAREVAAKSMVLLKNENLLPLNPSQKIAVIGPKGQSEDLMGPWCWQGQFDEVVTVYEGIKEVVGEGQISYAQGCLVDTLDRSHFEEALEVVKRADVVVLTLGETMEMSGESACRTQITLPGVQQELAREIYKLKKPTVAILFNGRPLEIAEVSQGATALLEAWYPGTEAGSAIADILFGKVNPQGRLTMSFPHNVGQIPVYYNCYTTGRPKPFEENTAPFFSQYLDCPNAPLYPFGYGLSYSPMAYREFKLDAHQMNREEFITASVIVRNEGRYTGTETVQFYIRDLVGSTVRPLKELKGYKQVMLKPGEETTVTFTINEEMLKFHNFRGEFVAEAGEFVAMVGPNSREVKELLFELV